MTPPQGLEYRLADIVPEKERFASFENEDTSDVLVNMIHRTLSKNRVKGCRVLNDQNGKNFAFF